MNSINVNDYIKVKLTPLGAEIFFHQYDELLTKHPEVHIKPHMPHIDHEGFTQFQFWHFIELYGAYFYMGAEPVIQENRIYFEEEEENEKA